MCRSSLCFSFLLTIASEEEIHTCFWSKPLIISKWHGTNCAFIVFSRCKQSVSSIRSLLSQKKRKQKAEHQIFQRTSCSHRIYIHNTSLVHSFSTTCIIHTWLFSLLVNWDLGNLGIIVTLCHTMVIYNMFCGVLVRVWCVVQGQFNMWLGRAEDWTIDSALWTTNGSVGRAHHHHHPLTCCHWHLTSTYS